MALPGKEIYRGYDAFGVVSVFEDGAKRYLSFGEADEQSCWLKTEPAVPQHEYVRAMLLALLFTEPRHAITLGLGAGSLNSCLHAHYPSLKQQVVELRPEVVEVAYRFFQLPRGKRLQIHTMDANEFLSRVETKRADLVFSDIYGADGLDEQQLSPDYLLQCRERLKADGWLVLNCWREHQGSQSLDTLRELFADVRGCATQSGNWILFAGCRASNKSSKQLKAEAKALGQQLGFSLSGHLSRLQSYNR
jgi:spermidine synthase